MMSPSPSQIVRPPWNRESGPDALPAFPFGAVYFRKSNPPPEDWERDYATAAEDGMNIFRHWFPWSAIEVSPGKYEWSDYDRHLDLAARNGIKTIIAEMIQIAPEWAYKQYAHARLESREGRKANSGMHGSCAVGGAPGLCLDNEDLREHAERFLVELVTRYKDHPGLGGYDIKNECGMGQCFCPGTAEKFRQWLKGKYGDLQTLGEAWRRYSYSKWEYVDPPRHIGPYPDVLDWVEFHNDNLYRLIRWRFDVVRGLDKAHPITAHGVAGTLTRMASSATDDWRSAAEVESYGYTWGSSRHGDEPWKQFHAVDLVRAACRGKPFWHAEAYAGPLWMARNVLNKPRDEGRIAYPDDVRYWHMASFMAGATGSLYLRWRPLLDGPLFGAFGPYGLDGSRTDRSAASSEVAKWVAAPAQENLWRSRPIRGEIGILYVPETQVFLYAQQGGKTGFYSSSMQGAYQGFFDNNVQADWVHVDDMDVYDVLYLPIPVMLKEQTAARIIDWVRAGGVLISEGCPAYFGDRGHAGVRQPNLGLDELFGVRESYVEFTPDLLGDLEFDVDGNRVRGGLFLQAYEPTGASPRGSYDDGRIAAASNVFGKGRTLLIGSMCGAGYAGHPDNRSPALFAEILRFADKEQHVQCDEARVKARLHNGAGGVYLWVANPTRQPLPARLTFGSRHGPFSSARPLRGPEAEIDGRTVSLVAPGRDVTVIELTE
jgi:beta-galactosidase